MNETYQESKRINSKRPCLSSKEGKTLEEIHGRKSFEFGPATGPAQATNASYSQHKKAFINYVTNHHNIASLNIPEPGPPIKYVSRLSIEGYLLTCQKNKVVAEATIDKFVSTLGHMSTRE